ncbi:MAG TPA: plastocyanin/azurin family copper-binding protein [Gemmatimonadaceae bacterium]|nr:plastocyanin/azurin family copper-binding protein [Gemmatimonadaceae bacterium]
MRFYGLALAASAMVLGACGGDKNKATDTAAPAAASGDTTVAPAATTTPAAGASTAAMAPITGKTVEVKMVGDEKGYRFEPADITIKAGDGIKFTMVSGGPHNFAMDPAEVPANAKSQISANMPNQMAELSGPLLVNPNETYTVSFANVPAGKYNYHCTPHLAMGMKGTITVQ